MPFGKEVVEIARVGGAIVRLNVTFAVCAGEPLSATLKVSEALLTAAVGVPLITPVLAFKDRPAGSAPAGMLQV